MTDPPPSPTPGGGGGGAGIPPGTLPGDDDEDGTTANNGPIGYAGCVAVKMGFTGWAAIGATGISAYQMYEARKSTDDKYREYIEYNNAHYAYGSTSPYDPLLEKLLYNNYMESRNNENVLWAQLSLSGGVALRAIGVAAAVCWPIGVAPEP
ncbi:MAG TPA: hypothetical protein VFE05_00995 [Longimicrobiaceae bacterium]|nr:hypothetical protein [Longimicrobiaceae bacterium]